MRPEPIARSKRRGDALRAVAYVRVSTDEQALGPDAQRDAIAKWAASNGVVVVAWHADLGVSGAAPPEARPGLLAAMSSLAEHRAGLLIAAKRDRLGRDVVATAMLERLAQRAGARVVTADGIGSGDSPEAMLLRTLVDAFAAYERLVIKARTKAALKVKMNRFERCGQIAYGWALAPDGVRLVPEPAEHAVLARIGALRASGLSLRRIVAQLDAEGAVCRGSRWHLKTLARIVRSGRAVAA
jgi:DNA invertase Pin-like site-specific DNA recombinase